MNPLLNYLEKLENQKREEMMKAQVGTLYSPYSKEAEAQVLKDIQAILRNNSSVDLKA